MDAPPLVARHLMVGCSTGWMRELRGEWEELAERAALESWLAVELSALSLRELPGLIDFLAGVGGWPFEYTSVHAPSKGLEAIEDAELVSMLAELPPWIDAIVVHPDTMRDVRAFRRLGRTLVLENMDARKPSGRTAAELAPLWDVLPEAGLCFDIAHAKAVDPALVAGAEILARFGHRLRHVHLSSLDAGSHHVPLTEADEAQFATLLAQCRDVPWILEAELPAR
jgi:hypothetical protein